MYEERVHVAWICGVLCIRRDVAIFIQYNVCVSQKLGKKSIICLFARYSTLRCIKCLENSRKIEKRFQYVDTELKKTVFFSWVCLL